jgi:hypothetical protein
MENTAAIDAFIGTVITRKNEDITDEVFLLIQNDRTFMQQYLRLVETETLDEVNKRIGKKVREVYGLPNTTRNQEPKSTLIQSFQRHG